MSFFLSYSLFFRVGIIKIYSMEPVWILAVFILGLSSGKEASF